MYQKISEIKRRPALFERYTAYDLWADEHRSKKMLDYHMEVEGDTASRNHAFIDRSADWIFSHFNLNENTRVADFGCGPGFYCRRLAEKGAPVTGIDFSSRSIEYAINEAERLGLQIKYVNRNYLEFETNERFHLIMMIMCDYCALSPVQRKSILKKFRKLLEPSGSVFLDVYSLAAFNKRNEETRFGRNLENGFWSANDYYCFINTYKYEIEKVTLDKYTIIEHNHEGEIFNWLQYFSETSIRRELEEEGFRIEELFANAVGAKFEPQNEEFAITAKI